MDQEPLVMEEIEAGAQFVRAFDRSIPIRAAFWLKDGDEGHWYLYLASDRIDDANFHLAYREVIRLSNQMQLDDFDPFQVKVINAEKPLAKAAIEINQIFPTRRGTRLRRQWFGGDYIDSAYIYPSPVPAAVV